MFRVLYLLLFLALFTPFRFDLASVIVGEHDEGNLEGGATLGMYQPYYVAAPSGRALYEVASAEHSGGHIFNFCLLAGQSGRQYQLVLGWQNFFTTFQQFATSTEQLFSGRQVISGNHSVL